MEKVSDLNQRGMMDGAIANRIQQGTFTDLPVEVRSVVKTAEAVFDRAETEAGVCSMKPALKLVNIGLNRMNEARNLLNAIPMEDVPEERMESLFEGLARYGDRRLEDVSKATVKGCRSIL